MFSNLSYSLVSMARKSAAMASSVPNPLLCALAQELQEILSPRPTFF